MESSPRSEFFYANKYARILIEALEDVMGRNGLNAVLNLAHLSHLIDNYPPENLEHQFSFVEFSALVQALEETYGQRGGRGLALHAGRAAFAELLRNFGAMSGVGDLAFRILPLQTKLRVGLPAMAKISSQISDQQTTVREQDKVFVYTIRNCPVCWGRSGSDKPVCFITIGLLQEGLKWVSGGNEFRVNESRCVAMGDEVCEFIIQKEPAG